MVGEKPLSEIFQCVVRDIQELFRSEVRLAKSELNDDVSKAKSAATLMAPAMIAALFAGMCMVAACIALLALVLPVWAASLIMAAVLGIAGALLFSIGRARLRAIHGVPETVQTMRDNVEWAKQLTR